MGFSEDKAQIKVLFLFFCSHTIFSDNYKSSRGALTGLPLFLFPTPRTLLAAGPHPHSTIPLGMMALYNVEFY